jgi:alpha-ketoglutarate-dependent taurine dioxygenase
MKKTGIPRLKNVKPTAVNLSKTRLIQLSYFQSKERLPLVLNPIVEDLNLAVWIQNNLELVETHLLKDGGLLFRGFDINNQADFNHFINSISLQAMPYREGATPRTQVSEKIYTSTEYPSEQSIRLHNELTYVIPWPMKICFFCVNPAEQGGETPIADVRRVFKRIEYKIVERFRQKGWMLVRNFGEGFGPSWQTSFGTTDKAVVESYCRRTSIELEWKDGNRLRTRQVRPAMAKHPKTGEIVWFNHIAFWHISSLEPKLREMFLAEFKEEDLPYNTYYGDGSPIEPSVIEEILEAYYQETVMFSWQQGDLLMLDNMLVAHGRNPFSGSRKILVAMGNPFTNNSEPLNSQDI